MKVEKLLSKAEKQVYHTKKIVESTCLQRFLWYHQDSNRGHTDFQSDALPTELWHQFVGFANSFATGKSGTKLALRSPLFSFAGAKVRLFFGLPKFFIKKMPIYVNFPLFSFVFQLKVVPLHRFSRKTL